MLKIVTVIGARPQIIKAAAISRCIKKSFSTKINEIIVHTGQHYDENMSEIFFNEMEVPIPKHNLNVGSQSQAKQTATMMMGLEEVLIKEDPGVVLLYGDTNSTLAGSVTAAKLHIPVVHVEAGLRSFNQEMPEEINRILCDHISALLFSPTYTGIKNLQKEGLSSNNKSPFKIGNPGVFHCGDVMFDNCLYFTEIAEKKSSILLDLNLQKENYILVTIHRDNNTDNPERLNSIFSAIDKISSENNLKAVIPLHPRTTKILKSTLNEPQYLSIIKNPNIEIIDPVSFFDMINLEKNSKMILRE